MTRILIRCDASLSIGSGHAIRSRTLARQLRRQGAEVLFLCRRQPGDLIALLEQEFRVLALPEQELVQCEGLAGRELYGAWLGCSQDQDADDCLTALASAGVRSADWLVVDHYGLDASWEAQLLNALAGDKGTPKLLAIDDLADRPHKADLLLDQNFFGAVTEQRYQGLIPSRCCKLLGPHYALLGPEYAQLHRLVPVRTELHRILVFFGGVDQANLTALTLKALMCPELAHLVVDVVVGAQSPHRKEIEELVARRPQTNLYASLPSLAGLIARADMAIGAGGSTSWERIALRLPSLVIAFGLDQLAVAKALDIAGYIVLLGDNKIVTLEDIRSALLTRKQSLARRRKEPPALTDGYGAPRLAMAMLGVQRDIRLRQAVGEDEELLLRWVNDPQVRANSFSPDEITPSVHHDWFDQGQGDPNRLLLIAVAADGCPIGQIRFDRKPLPSKGGSDEALVDLSLDRCARGLGLGVDLVRKGLEVMEQTWGPSVQAVAEVLTTNQASNACFNRAGFIQDPILEAVQPSATVYRWRYRRAAITPPTISVSA